MPGGDHLGWWYRTLESSEEVSRRPASKQRPVTARHDGSEIPRLEARRCVPNPENTAMNGDESSDPGSLLELGGRDPGA